MIAPDTYAHHSVNVAAIALPVLSLWFNLPTVLSAATGVLACVWYCILIGERLPSLWHKFRTWRNRS